MVVYITKTLANYFAKLAPFSKLMVIMIIIMIIFH